MLMFLVKQQTFLKKFFTWWCIAGFLQSFRPHKPHPLSSHSEPCPHPTFVFPIIIWMYLTIWKKLSVVNIGQKRNRIKLKTIISTFEWKNKMSKQTILVRAMKQDLQVEVAHHRAKKKNGRTFINKLHAYMCYYKAQNHWEEVSVPAKPKRKTLTFFVHL